MKKYKLFNLLKKNQCLHSIYKAYSFYQVHTLAKYLERLERVGNENRIIDEQKKRLYALLYYARQHSIYYSNLMNGKTLSEENSFDILFSLPILTKDIIRANSIEIYSDEISPEWSNWQNTGGSTGEPLNFPFKIRGVSLELAHQKMLYARMGWKPGECIVSIDGSRIPTALQKKHIYWIEGNNFPYGKYSYSTLCMKKSTLKYYISSLNNIKPVILRGYPSGFLEISRYIQDNQLTLLFKPKGIYLTSEQFSNEEQIFISTIFNCPVYGQYGHTEASVFATTENNLTEYICSPFYGITEILDNEGKPVSIGDTGELVVTGFSNIGLPFIRYKTGDLAVYGGTKNGFVILSSLLGRTADYIWNSNLEKIYLVGFIFGGHLKAFNYISDWQIEQAYAGRVLLKIVKTAGYTPEIENELYTLFKKKKIEIEIIYLLAIPKTLGGKKLFLVQHLK